MAYIPKSDEQFRAWVEKHPDGFVVNSDEPPNAGYLILHRATCGTINSSRWNNYAGKDYRKTCFPSRSDVGKWQSEAGGHPQPCGICRP